MANRIWEDPRDERCWEVSLRIGGGDTYPDLIIFIPERGSPATMRYRRETAIDDLTDEELCDLLDAAQRTWGEAGAGE